MDCVFNQYPSVSAKKCERAFSILNLGSLFDFKFSINGNYSWICNKSHEDGVALIVQKKGSGTLYVSENLSKNRSIILTAKFKSLWIISTMDGTRIDNYKRLCKKRPGFCSHPLIGSNSYVLSKSNLYGVSGHLTKEAFNKV